MTASTSSQALPAHVRVAIIGAGFAGLGAAKMLQENGTEFLILERRSGVGGTWWDNTYPGVACDVASHLYSFSFAPNPDWTRSFADGPQIQRYLDKVTDSYHLRDKIHFNVDVEQAVWNEDTCQWRLATSQGSVTADLVIVGTGPLSAPSFPDVPGLDSFTGVVMHTAQWDHNVDLTGKRIAVVGTGASAIQVVPEMQKIATELTVFQRSAAWVMPKNDRPLTKVENWVYRHVPGVQKLARGLIYGGKELLVPGFVLRPSLLRVVELISRTHRNWAVRDPKLREILTPDYRLGCKRILPNNQFYPAVAKSNVTVVPSALARVEGSTAVAVDGTRVEVDAIILATGFKVTDSPLGEMAVGRNGVKLKDAWAQTGMQALRGTTVHGFPNAFVLIGPNTGLGHTSMVYMIESQLPYIRQAIATMEADGVAAIEPTAEAQRVWNEKLQARMPKTVWATGGCASWYQDEQGRITTLWPHSTLTFRRTLKRFNRSEFTRIHRRDVAAQAQEQASVR